MIKRIKLSYLFCTVSKPTLWERLSPFNKKKTNSEETPDYSKMIDQVLKATIENDELRQSVQKLMYEIKQSIELTYSYPVVQEVLRKIQTQHLCNAAVESFVGSMSNPRNESLMGLFLQYAQMNAKTSEEQQMVQFYTLHLRKLSAIQIGNEEEFKIVNEKLLELAQQDCSIAKHLIAKEMYKVALNMLGSKNRKQKEQMLKESLRMFRENVDAGFPHSFYYIGEMAESGDIPGGVNLQLSLESYTIAASFDNPSAYFKLSKFYKEGFLVNKDPQLEYFYMKKAAELGLKEAMHNLAVMYKEGKIIKLDEIKAISWFTHAGYLGFPPSMYNAAMMFKKGTSDGFVLPNKKAALVWLEKLHKQAEGQVDVTSEINKIIQEMEEEETIQKQY